MDAHSAAEIVGRGDAFSRPDSAEDRFRQFDKNGDGKITREESGNAAWFDTLDLNHDGVVTLEETRAAAAIGAAKAKRGGVAGGVSDELQQVLAYRKDSPGPVPLSDSKAFTDLRFTRDWVPGTKDRNGRLMTGTECNYIVAHGGRLYAAVSVWNHDPAAPNPGPGVLVKKSADAPWEVDVQFHPRNVRVPVLASLTFGTDVAGKRLDPPVKLLVSGSGSFEHPGQITVQVRDDAQGIWMPSFVASSQGVRSFEVRHLVVHRDRVTGVDRVIAALTSGSVFSGGYDAGGTRPHSLEPGAGAFRASGPHHVLRQRERRRLPRRGHHARLAAERRPVSPRGRSAAALGVARRVGPPRPAPGRGLAARPHRDSRPAAAGQGVVAGQSRSGRRDRDHQPAAKPRARASSSTCASISADSSARGTASDSPPSSPTTR